MSPLGESVLKHGSLSCSCERARSAALGHVGVGRRERVGLPGVDALADVPVVAVAADRGHLVGVLAVDVDGRHDGEAVLGGGDDLELVVVDRLEALSDHRVGATVLDRGTHQVVLAALELVAVEDLLELVGVQEGRDQGRAVDLAQLGAGEDREAVVGGLLDAGETEVLEAPLPRLVVVSQEEGVPLAVEVLADVHVTDGRGGELGDAVLGHVGLDGLAELLRGVGVHAAGRLDADDQRAVGVRGVDLVGVELDDVDELELSVVDGAGLVGDLDAAVAVGLVEGEAGGLVGRDRRQLVEVVGLVVEEAGNDEGQGQGTHDEVPLSWNTG